MNTNRLPAIDWMRGLVMILMAIDHASSAFNNGKLSVDSFLRYVPGMELPLDQLFTRGITHLCAITFLFLAGVSLYLSAKRRGAHEQSSASIDKDMLIRGIFIILLEVFWISPTLSPPGKGIMLQVLFVIGACFIMMIPLRRLSPAVLFVLASGIIMGNELFLDILHQFSNQTELVSVFFGVGFFEHFFVIYPVFPWLAVMMLGWCFGHILQSNREPTRFLLVSGLICLGIFSLFLGFGGYGNMRLYPEGNLLTRVLLISKYPPSITFVALELGIMSVVLAVFFAIQGNLRASGTDPSQRNPLLLLGQTALFFYVIHFPLLKGVAKVLGVYKELDVASAYVGALLVTLVLLRPCWKFRAYKKNHRWVRFM